MISRQPLAKSKVPAVTLGFWIIKILATTLGETGGDTVTMTLNWAISSAPPILRSVLSSLVARADRARSDFIPFCTGR